MKDPNSATTILKDIKTKDHNFWQVKGNSKKQQLYKTAFKSVPAYKKFLEAKEIKINQKDITDINFNELPAMTKDEYLRKYAWKELCYQNALAKESIVLTSTSGSTGTPFYFPRNTAIDFQSSICHQVFLENAGIDKHKSTLVIVCFGMGVWIGGVITYEAFKMISERGYALSIITPGVNKKEIFEAMKNIAPHYDQIVLCGYPPFVKDIIDEGKAAGVTWNQHDLRVVFAAESFSEKFRDHILKKTGIKNVYRHTMNIYGSADIGTMATESPLCILLRRLSLKNKKLFKNLFAEANRLPTLTQYIPHFINFDEKEGHVYLSGDNVLPLIRYEIGDNGGVFTFEKMVQQCMLAGVNIKEEARKAGIEDSISELPFVYIYERTDLSTKLYGAIIYPEYIKAGLHEVHLEEHITGKFSMITQHDENQDEYLEINMELKAGVNESEELKEQVGKAIFEALSHHSAEYAYLKGMLKERVHPKIVLWPHEHPTHFRIGIKQKWVKKKDL